MMNSLPFFIGLRYVRARRRNQFVSFISASSMIGIALGVAVLIVVLSVINGFERELKDRVLGVTPHLTVSELFGPLKDFDVLRAKLASRPGVEAVAPFVTVQAIISAGDEHRFAQVFGVDPAQEKTVSRLPALVGEAIYQRLQTQAYGMILGEGLAKSLGAKAGDKLIVLAPDGQASQLGGVPKAKRFELIGTVKVGAEMDANLALIKLGDAAELAAYEPGQISGLRLKLTDLFGAQQLNAELRSELDGSYYLQDWTATLGNLYAAIQMNKRQMFLLLVLIIAVAAFNIVSTLVMAVNDKRGDIAILRTQGASPRTVMGIFIVQGAMNGVVGTVAGLLIGVTLALNISAILKAVEQWRGTPFLTSDVYFIDFVPSQLIVTDLLIITGASLLMSLLATLYPAWRAARVQPAEALRYD